jgi:thiol-disulfide isomerase/thioredoxin
MAKTKENKTAKKQDSTPQEPTLYFFYTQGCGWCKKVDPIVDELIADGYEILKLDLADGENNKLQAEIKKEYNIQCGTPLFVDAESGNTVCGFREKELLEKWAKGEEVPAPAQPKGRPPQLPLLDADEKEIKKWKTEYNKWYKENKDLPNVKTAEAMLELPRPKTTPPSPPAPNADDKALDEWKVKYEEWAKENSHLPSLLESDTIVERFKQRRDGTAQAPPQAQIATNLNPDQEARLSRLEQKLDKLIKHLGVK